MTAGEQIAYNNGLILGMATKGIIKGETKVTPTIIENGHIYNPPPVITIPTVSEVVPILRYGIGRYNIGGTTVTVPPINPLDWYANTTGFVYYGTHSGYTTFWACPVSSNIHLRYINGYLKTYNQYGIEVNLVFYSYEGTVVFHEQYNEWYIYTTYTDQIKLPQVLNIGNTGNCYFIVSHTMPIYDASGATVLFEPFNAYF